MAIATSMFNDLVFRMACQTPLPGTGTGTGTANPGVDHTATGAPANGHAPGSSSANDNNAGSSAANGNNAGSSTQGEHAGQSSAPPDPPNYIPIPRRNKRAPAFEIHTDPDTVARPPKRPSTSNGARPRADGRKPLTDRKDFGNIQGKPSRIRPDQPPRARPNDTTSAQSQNSSSVPPSPRVVELPPPRSMYLYGLLELTDFSATTVQIRCAYRRLALRIHPDKVAPEFKDAATEHFVKVQAAYEVLVDTNLRRRYDRDGRAPAAAFSAAT